MSAPKLLDLFCGAGGCSVGYSRAGFDVFGVDITPHADYPFPMVDRDALEVLDHLLSGGGLFFKCGDQREYLTAPDFAVIHASPPCQASTTMSNRWRGAGGKADQHVNLIPDVRDALVGLSIHYVIENVPGARDSMLDPITLSGGAFGLRVNRPRLFESSVTLTPPTRVPVVDPLGVYGKSPDGRRLFTRKDGSVQRAARGLAEGAAAMGIDWMTAWEDVTEAIPPAYTEHLGSQLLAHLSSQEIAS